MRRLLCLLLIILAVVNISATYRKTMFVGDTQPTSVELGDVWVDTSGTATLKVCTSISPVTFTTSSGEAPLDATYITQTANTTLTGEQALSTLATGLMKVTTGTGVVSSVASFAGDVTGAHDATVVGDDSHAHTSTTISGVDISADTNLAVTAPVVLTGDTLSIPVATSSVDGYLDNADWTTFNNKEPAISAGTTAQYYRGDESWQTLNQAAVAGLTTASTPTFTNMVLSGLSQGGLIFPNTSSQLLQDATKLYWDDTNDRLGIGTATPAAPLDINTAKVGAGTDGLRFSINSGTGSANDYLTFQFFMRSGTPNTQLAGSMQSYIVDPAGFSSGMQFTTVNGGVQGTRLTIDDTGNAGFNTTNQFGGGAGVIGLANATTASTSAPTGGLVLESIGGILKVYQSNGTVVTVANPAAGTMVLLYSDTSQNTLSATGVLETFTLPANTYTSIIVECGWQVTGAANTEFNWNVQIRDNTVTKGNAVTSAAGSSGAGEVFTISGVTKAIFTETSAVAVDAYASEVTFDTTSIVSNFFYVWGVL